MLQRLVNHNQDIKQLVDRGFAVTCDSNHLVVRDIPYLDNALGLQWGGIVTKLVFVDQDRVVQEDHQIFFAGATPHGLDGKPVPNLGGGTVQVALSEACKDVVVQRSFSNKPKEGGKFRDFFQKIENYVSLISGPAIEKYNAKPYTFRYVEEAAEESVFEFRDTLSSLAEITDLSAKLKDDVIAVIGLGGTGSYVLDFLVKTPVREIRGFDLDVFYVHNAFRSPGQLDPDELGRTKTEVYLSRYKSFRKGFSGKSRFIDETSSEELDGVTFAFVCVDKGFARSKIFDLLISKKIPFIDVGMGLDRKRGPISGMVRMTYYSVEDAQRVRDKQLAPLVDTPDDEYRTNIQICELNALNASLAVLKYKQVRGFYLEDEPDFHLLFQVEDLKTFGKDSLNED